MSLVLRDHEVLGTGTLLVLRDREVAGFPGNREGRLFESVA